MKKMKPYLLTPKNFNQLKDEVKKNSSKKSEIFSSSSKNVERDKQLIFASNDDELNRKVLEKLPIQLLLIELSGRKDFQKQRNSGFNHVLAKIAKKNNVSIGIDLDELINSENKPEILARIIQNIKICNKNKIQMKFVSKKYSKNIYDLKSLGLILGMPTSMIKNLELIKL